LFSDYIKEHLQKLARFVWLSALSCGFVDRYDFFSILLMLGGQ
jgi:hypothetical protein